MVEDRFGNLIDELTDGLIKQKIQNNEIHNTPQAIEKAIEDIYADKRYQEAICEIYKKESQKRARLIRKLSYEKVLYERAYENEFLARQDQIWGEAFITSEILYICTLESAESYSTFVAEQYKGTVSYLFCALRMIHGRAMQMYLEIICLIKNGFADGAYARWRSLYELAIISAFIKKYGESVAKSYLDMIGGDQDYEWARKASCFTDNSNHSKKISFNQIRKWCGLNKEAWDQEYSLSCQLVHASPTATAYRLGTPENAPRVIAVGRSNYGVGKAAIHAAQTLCQITSDFFSVLHHGDSILAASTFFKWTERIKRTYTQIVQRCIIESTEAPSSDTQR